MPDEWCGEFQKRHQINPNLGRRVNEFKWTVRTENCFRNEGINYIWHLASRSGAELLRIPNFGKVSLTEVKEVLGSLDLSLGLQLSEEEMEAVRAAMKEARE